MRASLSARLGGAFIGLAVGPLLIVGALLAERGFVLQKHQALDRQHHVVERIAAETAALIHGVADELTVLVRVRGLEDMDASERHALLSELLAYQSLFAELAWLDGSGRERVRLSRLEVVTAADLTDRANREEFRAPHRDGRTWFGPVAFDPATNEPRITVAVPSLTPRERTVTAVLVADVRLKKVWDRLAALASGPRDALYILDGGGRVVAHRDPSVVLRGTRVDPSVTDGIDRNLDGGWVLRAHTTLSLGEQSFLVVAEAPLAEALALPLHALEIVAAAVAIALAAAAVLIVLARRGIIEPIRRLAEVAGQIRNGDLSRTAAVTSRDEIGDLAAAFNGMTARLRDSLEALHLAKEDLELRVAERTRDLTAEITERHYIEKALRESEQRFRDMTEAASDWFWEMGPTLRFTYLSPRVHDDSGHGRLLFLGRTLDECADPDHRRRHAGKWQDVVRDLGRRRPFRHLPCALIDDDGRKVHLRVSGKPYFDDDGTFLGYRGIITDVSAEVEAEIRAAQAQVQLADAIESVSEGFILYDTADRLVLCNGKLHEFYPEVAHLLVPDTRFLDLIRAVAERHLIQGDDGGGDDGGGAGGNDDAGNWLTRRADHHQRPHHSHIQHLSSGRWLLVNERRTASGNIVGIFTDITRIKHSEAALRAAMAQAERATHAKSEFLAHMSHELRTPLNAVIGFSDAILSEMFGPLGTPRYRDYIAHIHQSGHHLLDLINDILDLAKVEAGKLELDCRPIDLPTLIDDAATMVAERASHAGVGLGTVLSPILPRLVGDERRLRQILLNLLSNAIKFTPSGGRITVEARPLDDGGVELTVADTGIGIAPEDLDTVMEPFGQVESTQSRPHHGTGLGLPLTRQLVERHGGTLAIESAVGAGTTVRARFPPPPK